MEKIKITKAMVLKAIKEIAQGGEVNVTVDGVAISGEDIVAYADVTLEQLANKASKAKEKASQKKAEGDTLKGLVERTLSDSKFMTGDEITDEVLAIESEDENVIKVISEVTKAKVVARLRQLVESGVAEKKQVKIDGRKLMAYAIAGTIEEDAE